MEDSDGEFVVGLKGMFNSLRALTSPWTSQPSSTVCTLVNVSSVQKKPDKSFAGSPFQEKCNM